MIRDKRFSELPIEYFGTQDHLRWLHEYFEKQLRYNKLSQMKICTTLRREENKSKERALSVLVKVEDKLSEIHNILQRAIKD